MFVFLVSYEAIFKEESLVATGDVTPVRFGFITSSSPRLHLVEVQVAQVPSLKFTSEGQGLLKKEDRRCAIGSRYEEDEKVVRVFLKTIEQFNTNACLKSSLVLYLFDHILEKLCPRV
jgi:hypothetical protein